MNDSGALVLIPFGADLLALSREAFEQARVAGAKYANGHDGSASPVMETEPLLTAEQLGELTNTPASWWLEMARSQRVPHYRIGKHRRFKFSEATGAMRYCEREEKRARGHTP